MGGLQGIYLLVFSRISFWLSVIGVVFGILLLIQFAKPEPIPAPDVSPSPKPPGTRVAASGIVEAFGDNIKVAPPMGGVVTNVSVTAGEWVNTGQGLFELDSRLATAKVKSAEEDLAVARAELAKAEDSRNRLAKVKDHRAVSPEEIAMRSHAVAIAQAQVFAEEANLDCSQVRRDQLTVRSPRDGVVLQVNLRPGEFASPTSPVPPIVVGNSRELQIRVEVAEDLIPKLPEHPAAVAFMKGLPEHPIPLEFIRIDPLVLPKASAGRVDTRVLQLILKIASANVPQEIRIGQHVDIFFGQ